MKALVQLSVRPVTPQWSNLESSMECGVSPHSSRSGRTSVAFRHRDASSRSDALCSAHIFCCSAAHFSSIACCRASCSAHIFFCRVSCSAFCSHLHPLRPLCVSLRLLSCVRANSSAINSLMLANVIGCCDGSRAAADVAACWSVISARLVLGLVTIINKSHF